MTGFYYKKIHVNGQKSNKTTLFIASHRNGATDGQVYTWALAECTSLISIQMLRKWYLALIFDGIPVVRKVDTQRYNIQHQSVASPIDAAIRQLSEGGNLCILPEGTSEWQDRPLTYHNGMAKVVHALKQQNIDFDVQTVGVFYTKPHGFRSRVSIVLGQPFLPQGETVDEIFQQMSQELKQVSVNCHSISHFNQCQMYAWHMLKTQQQDYATAFLHAQQHIDQLADEAELFATRGWELKLRCCQLLFLLGFFPNIIAALLAQRAADGPNNVTFFRLLAGLYSSIFTLLYWLVLFWVNPLLSGIIIFLGLCGWYLYPEPVPEPLKDIT